ncbi:MAG: sigma-70 family RNA polymerase sigma factor [Polyangiaceae bacterium]|nr:sigma-70 family RNA polymerase sigma factor [Polyangiaceae bacterium]
MQTFNEIHSTRHPSIRPRLNAQQRSVRPRKLSPEAELQLTARLVAGEASAWREFTRLYAPVALGCIRKVLVRFSKVTDEQDVDEIYGRFSLDLLRNDCKKLQNFDPEKGSRLSTWIGMLATNSAYDYLRRIKKDQVCDPFPESPAFESPDDSPYEEVVLRQQAEQAVEIMTSLSERDQEFVQLFFGHGLSPEEISERMGIHVKTVYTKKHKIAAKLEKLLAPASAA